LALLSLPLAVPAAADPATSPADQPAQWIVVGVPAANATTGTLTAFQRVGQQWKAVLGPTPAKVGELGVGTPADGVHRTAQSRHQDALLPGHRPRLVGRGRRITHLQHPRAWIRQSLVNHGKPLRLRPGLRLGRQRRGKPATHPGTGGRDFSPRDRWQSHLGMCGHRPRRDALCAELARPFRVPGNHHRRRKPVAGPIRVVTWQHRSLQC
jgi:hypothetical protein